MAVTIAVSQTGRCCRVLLYSSSSSSAVVNQVCMIYVPGMHAVYAVYDVQGGPLLWIFVRILCEYPFVLPFIVHRSSSGNKH